MSCPPPDNMASAHSFTSISLLRGIPFVVFSVMRSNPLSGIDCLRRMSWELSIIDLKFLSIKRLSSQSLTSSASSRIKPRTWSVSLSSIVLGLWPPVILFFAEVKLSTSGPKVFSSQRVVIDGSSREVLGDKLESELLSGNIIVRSGDGPSGGLRFVRTDKNLYLGLSLNMTTELRGGNGSSSKFMDMFGIALRTKGGTTFAVSQLESWVSLLQSIIGSCLRSNMAMCGELKKGYSLSYRECNLRGFVCRTAERSITTIISWWRRSVRGGAKKLAIPFRRPGVE